MKEDIFIEGFGGPVAVIFGASTPAEKRSDTFGLIEMMNATDFGYKCLIDVRAGDPEICVGNNNYNLEVLRGESKDNVWENLVNDLEIARRERLARALKKYAGQLFGE